MLRIAIVEDDQITSGQLNGYVERCCQELGQETSVTCFPDGIELVEDYRPVWDIILLELVVKGSAGILKPSVAVKQRMGIGVGFHGLVKSLIDKRIVVAAADHVGNDAPVVQVKDSTQVEFVYRDSLIPFELRHIGEPLLIRLVCMELAVQDIFRNVLGIFGLPGAAMAVVFYRRAYIPAIISNRANLQEYASSMHRLNALVSSPCVCQRKSGAKGLEKVKHHQHKGI